ncbi:MAG: hypothetical protein KAT46_04285 [Deltaproteobacteria bacterium]|nr:hypothetical protein [Deltaproteobacteria bacterium]
METLKVRKLERLIVSAFLIVALGLVFPLTSMSAETNKKTSKDSASKSTLKPVRISSETLEADTSKNWIRFKGKVVIEGEYMLCTEDFFLSYGASKEIKEIVASGKVRIHQGSKRAKADKAVYDQEKRAIIITGKAVVSECLDRVSGEKITLYLDNDTVLVDGGEGGRVRVLIMPEKDCENFKESKEFECVWPR